MQPNHAIDHSKSKIQEFSEQLSAANPFCALGCLGQVSPGGRAMAGGGGQVCSLQPTCLSTGPKVQPGLCHCSCSPLLLPHTAACHKAASSPVLPIIVANKLLTYLCATQITLIKFSSFKIFVVTNSDSSTLPTYG